MCSLPCLLFQFSYFFFFNDTATTEIYTLSLHDALPICEAGRGRQSGVDDCRPVGGRYSGDGPRRAQAADRKSTRLNSSHTVISYAVFCLKKKKTTTHSQAYRSRWWHQPRSARETVRCSG